MNSFKLESMLKGWFIGSFEPAAFQTRACEVAFKKYKAGDKESAHFHKVATEITLVASGNIKMMETMWSEGDIIVLEPGSTTSFEAITDASTVVVKVPGVKNDKFLLEPS